MPVPELYYFPIISRNRLHRLKVMVRYYMYVICINNRYKLIPPTILKVTTCSIEIMAIGRDKVIKL